MCEEGLTRVSDIILKFFKLNKIRTNKFLA
jgi:hypothetical protein